MPVFENAQPALVFGVENSGAACVKPVLPALSELQDYPMLPDPFAWSNGSGRAQTLADWKCRRNEIKAEIELYEIGPKPNKPENITATLEANVLTVNVTVNGQTLTLTSKVVIPEGDGPFPVVIGMNSRTGKYTFFSVSECDTNSVYAQPGGDLFSNEQQSFNRSIL